MTQLSIVVPCFNEEAMLPETFKRLTALLDQLMADNKIADSSRVYFVDDGSRDRTWELIEEAFRENPRIGGVKLSRNMGHQKALLAGLLSVPGDAIVSIDADLQDDPQVITQMLSHYHSGAQIVYGVRRRRDTDTRFKRMTAEAYYHILQAMGVDVVFNHADYRLMSRRAVDALKDYGEVNVFLRGIIPTIGYQSTVVEYNRVERFAGESKYPLRKMIALALDGVTSFSAMPLRFIALLGLMTFVGSILISLWVLWIRLVSEDALPGWASTVLPMSFLGGMQLLGIGVLGEYVSKIYMETKRRPRYIIDRMI